ncbi:MAG: hypothetical protein RBT47_02710, partial [Anaerolineae bacterium]|nr:hypothetical protein [Anaerolineae bacterium]
VLLEVAYHDHVENANALKDPRFNQIAARAIYQGIVHYFHGKDAITLPEPPTHLRVQNQGDGQVRVAWSPSPTDAGDEGLLGGAATAYRVYTSPDGFAWGTALPVIGSTAMTLTGRTAGETLYVRVTAVNAGGESFPTEVLGARVGNTPSLLIVNGYDKLNRFGLVQEVDPTEGPNLRMDLERINSRDYTVHHGQAVPTAYAWDSASNEAVASGAVDLIDYPMVDWILGEESTEEDGTLNAAERSKLTTFLAQDGALLISGTELAWELEEEGSAPDFLHTQLRTAYVSDDAGTYQVAPVAGRAFDGMGTFLFDAPGEYDADYPDVLTPWSGSTAAAALTYGSGGTAAVQFADGCERLLVLGFPLEVVRPDARPLVMAKALDFLGECAVSAPETGVTTPVDGHYYNAVPQLAGWASGAAVSAVQVQVRRDADGLFWTGTQWDGAASWLDAAGTTAWSYTLPALGNGAYTVGARAAVSGTVDATPAQVTFTLDMLAPLAPTLITPTGGITLTGSSVYFEWEAPVDEGSPLTYNLVVDAITRTVAGPDYRIVLGVGEHCWRVQAVDAAGNAGPWAEEACFFTEGGPAVYMPLALVSYTSEPGPEPLCSLILEDGFEDAEGWNYSSAPGSYAERVAAPVYLGGWAALVGVPSEEGGGGSVTYASISRALALPADSSQITLRFWGYGVSEAGDSGDLHYVGLRDAEAAWHSLSTQTTDAWDWEEHTFDLTAYAGQTVTLYVGAKNDGDDDTAALYVDAVQVEVCVR